MLRSRPLAAALSALLLLSACDAGDAEGPSSTYRTTGADQSSAALRLPDGTVVVGGLTEGTIAPADGTIGFPVVVRFPVGGSPTAAVDRSSRPDFGGVTGLAPWRDGLALVRRGANDRVQVVSATAAGRAGEVLFETPDYAFASRDALARVGSRLVLAATGNVSGPHLWTVGADGAPGWTARLDGAQDVRALAVGAEGDLFVVGATPDAVGARLGRLAADGQPVWTQTVPGSPNTLAASAAGVALVETAFADGVETLLVTAYHPNGTRRWSTPVASVRVGAGGAGVQALAMAPDGTAYVAVASGSAFEGGLATDVVTLGPDGAERARRRVGPRNRVTFVTHVVPRADAAPLLVLNVGPRQLNGYGGDDFDIVVEPLP